MIDIYCKIRNRISKEFVLRHLAYFLGAFSDHTKYRITIYNEDFGLPKEYYDAYTVVNKHDIQKNHSVKHIHDKIDQSKLAECWKGAARALSAQFFYPPSDSEYVVGIDADDFFIPGPITHYTDLAIKAIQEYQLPCLSADYLFSYNLFDTWRARSNGGKGFIPFHWSFGYTPANTSKMCQEIDYALTNLERLVKFIPNCKIPLELNIDILLSVLFQHERPHYKYNCFITKEGFWHRGFHDGGKSFYYTHLTDNDKFCWRFNEQQGIANLHPKTLILR